MFFVKRNTFLSPIIRIKFIFYTSIKNVFLFQMNIRIKILFMKRITETGLKMLKKTIKKFIAYVYEFLVFIQLLKSSQHIFKDSKSTV